MATGTSDAPPDTQEPQGKGRKAVGSQRRSWRHLLGILGPGLVTGAADDDPSGIATYSQTGAQFGYGQLWTALWMLPLVIGVQEACGRIGNITGKGLARNIITGSMLIGLCLNFIGVNPIRFLVFAAVFNGVAAVPLIWIINRIAADRGTMGEARSRRLSRTVLAMIVSYLKG
jgi:Mn2+/Fe2+ NRAMP family transporter